jgi:hypothetical protein
MTDNEKEISHKQPRGRKESFDRENFFDDPGRFIQSRSRDGCTAEGRSHKACVAEGCPHEAGVAEGCSGKSCTAKGCPYEAGVAESCSGKSCTAESSITEGCTYKDRVNVSLLRKERESSCPELSRYHILLRIKSLVRSFTIPQMLLRFMKILAIPVCPARKFPTRLLISAVAM